MEIKIVTNNIPCTIINEKGIKKLKHTGKSTPISTTKHQIDDESLSKDIQSVAKKIAKFNEEQELVALSIYKVNEEFLIEQKIIKE